MSRLAKNIIPLASGTTVSVAEHVLTVKGPLGTVTKKVNPLVTLNITAAPVKFIDKNGTVVP